MVQRFTLGQYIAVKRRDTAVKTGMPLIQVAANEAEEIFEAKSGGPQVERAGGAGLPWRDVMMLAKKCRIIAILTQDLSRSEENTSELQSLMRISYAVFCWKKKTETHKVKMRRTRTRK